MGAFVNKPFLSENKMIIDYASHHRKDYLDIYLASNCLFYLGDSCGFDAAITIFRRPKAITNYIPFEYYPSFSKSDMVIFKKIWLIRKFK